MPEKKTGRKVEKLLRRQYIFEGRALKLRIDTVLTADGHHSTREIIERNDCIAVVAINADDNVLLVNQYRTPLAKNLLEIPAGGIDKGEGAGAGVLRGKQGEARLQTRQGGVLNRFLHFTRLLR